MTLAVLGGSFDPVHSGHVAMARHVLEKGLAQKVLVVPAALSPFKTSTAAPNEDRLEMVRLAFRAHEGCEIDDREIRRQGPSFMIDTLEELHGENPGRDLRLVIGADNVPDFSRWHRATDILTMAKILILGRQGHQENYSEYPASQFIFSPGFDQRVSSTEIRAILADGGPVGDLLPAAVYRHIQDNKLYS